MKIIFAGTPEFAQVVLEAILQHGHQVSLLLTQPDRPAGRGMKLQASPVKQLALQRHIPVLQPASLNLTGKYGAEAQQAHQLIQQLVNAEEAVALVVVAYGLILPQWLLDLMQSRPQMLGCLNVHASLLPRWRGAAPIHRAIEAGDQQTGVCIMQMDAGLDTGAVLAQQIVDISDRDTTASLHTKLATSGAQLINQVLAKYPQLIAVPQPEQGVCYANKISKQEANINWQQDAQTICRKIRAFNPFPVAYSTINNQLIKIWQAEPVAQATSRAVGAISLDAQKNLVVNCGANGAQAIKIIKLQKPGAKPLTSSEFLNGFNLSQDASFG